MSLPKQLYDTYRSLCACNLVANKVITDETLAEFQTILNNAQPKQDDLLGQGQRSMVKSMYYSNKPHFMNYVSSREARVSAVVLWTESKQIVHHFGLNGKVHLSWSAETQEYTAARHQSNQANQANQDNQANQEAESADSKRPNQRTGRGPPRNASGRYITPRERNGRGRPDRVRAAQNRPQNRPQNTQPITLNNNEPRHPPQSLTELEPLPEQLDWATASE